jgi:hypothetical protein
VGLPSGDGDSNPPSTGILLEIDDRDIEGNAQKPMEQKNKEEGSGAKGHNAPYDSANNGKKDFPLGLANV